MIALRQTIAIFLDAYRELAAGKIFWISLGLSGVVVGVFALIGVSETGISIVGFDLDFLPLTYALRSGLITPDIVYKTIFVNLGIGLWLTWAASILGVVTTAGIFPTFLSAGVIDSHLARPMGRARLFLTKYTTGLLFMTSQVFVFTFASFLVIGIRGGAWEPRLFLAVPIVVCFFSYLYAFLAIVGILTRSTIAAMIATFIAWFALFLVNTTESALLAYRVNAELTIERVAERVTAAEEYAGESLAQIRDNGGEIPPRDEWPDGTTDELEVTFPQLGERRRALADAKKRLAQLTPWHDASVLARGVLPKTKETIDLLRTSVLSEEDRQRVIDAGSRDQRNPVASFGDEDAPSAGEFNTELEARLTQRGLWWTLGTSLSFEAALLVFGAWRFSRRDF
ncbi:MAG: hypothetical protein AAF108_08745 [Planctomycetota bacterium]